MDFIDIVKVTLESGNGGDGGIYFRREKYVPNGGPSGGDGGNGGSVILVASNDLQTLLDFKYKHIFKAEEGEKGRIKNQYGKKGQDLIVKVPVGTIIKDAEKLKVLADLKEENSEYIIKGGRGGRGNTKFATSTNKAPHYSEPGGEGIKKEVILELKSIADVGIIGLPNAGKSSLLSVISACKPKIANYPFTTLSPNLGVVKLYDTSSFVVADIPGLIEGAHQGVGLGHKFLRHIERTRLLVHLVDASTEDPLFDFETINHEISMYPGNISDKEKIIVLNKSDLILEEELDEILKKFSEKEIYPIVISSSTKDGIKDIINKISILLPNIPKIEFDIDIEEDIEDHRFSDDFEILKEDEDTFVIENYKIQKLLALTDIYDERALSRFMKIITGIGIIERLKEMDAKLGDTVRVGDFEFDYLPD